MLLRMVRYWLGRRDAIEEVARSRASIWLGLFFVLTAGIAREYDQAFLLNHPLAFLAPLILSLVLSATLYLLLYLVFFRKGVVPVDGEKRGGYRTFLNLFWMTAPMAWLYALPAERFLDPVSALKVNVALLALVSIWRVAVMTRALAVLTERPALPYLFWILLVGDILVLAGTFHLSLSLVGIMGGIVHSPAQSLLVSITNTVGGAAFFSLFLLAVALVISMVVWSKTPTRALPPCNRKEKPPWIGMAVLAVVWLTVLGFGQRQVSRNSAVESMYNDEDYRGVVAYLSSRSPGDFSPARTLPPARLSYYFSGGLAGMLSAFDGSEPAWVRAAYLERLGWLADDGTVWRFGHQPVLWIPALEGFPEGRQWLEDHRDPLQEVLDRLSPEDLKGEEFQSASTAAERMGFTWPNPDSE